MVVARNSRARIELPDVADIDYEPLREGVASRAGSASPRPRSAAGRDPDDRARCWPCRKTFPADAVRAVHALGQRAFGENYVQEAVAKRDALADLAGHRVAADRAAAGQQGARWPPQTFDWVRERRPAADRASGCRRARAAGPRAARRLRPGQHQRRGDEERRRAATRRWRWRAPWRRCRGLRAARHHGHPGADAATPRGSARSFAQLRACFDACRAAGLAVDTLSMGMSRRSRGGDRRGRDRGARRHGDFRRARSAASRRADCDARSTEARDEHHCSSAAATWRPR